MSIFDFVGDCVCAVVDTAIDGVSTVADFCEDNPATTVVLATAATGGLATAFAPTIAATIGSTGVLGATATTGTTISSLSGAALKSASLAQLGGGALAAGGGGMAAGTAVVGTSSAVLGGGVGTLLATTKK